MMADKVLLLGGGGHARVVAEAALLSGSQIVGHIALQPSPWAEVGPFLGADVERTDITGIWGLAIGMGFTDAHSRERRIHLVAEALALGVPLSTVVHPKAVISAKAELGSGCFVACSAVICAGARVGSASIVNTGAIVDHDCVIGKGAHIATGARLAGEVTVGEGSLVGVGASVIQQRVIGDVSIVGAGAVAIDDVPAGTTVAGIPARPL